MNFHIGQRVKRIANPGDPAIGPVPGQQGTVDRTADEDGQVWVVFDAPYPWHFGESKTHFGCDPRTLVPLTDPKADAFIEAVKSWKPEPVIPLPVKERLNQGASHRTEEM